MLLEYINISCNNPIKDSPLYKLMNANYSQDGRYMFLEGECYDTYTGMLTETSPLLLERTWSEWWSDVVHTGVDVVSAVSDVFTLGAAGFVIDIVHGIAYLVEAEYATSQERKDKLTLNGYITFAMSLLPAVLQSGGMALKSFVNGKLKKPSKMFVDALKWIKDRIGGIGSWVMSKMKEVANTNFAKKYLVKKD